MAIIDRTEVALLSTDPLSALDTEVIYEIAKRQGYVADQYDVDGSTLILARDQVTDAIAALTGEQNQLIRGLLTYLDDTGVDTFMKKGGQDGIDFSPTRDANSAEVDICRIVFNRRDPVIASGTPYFA